MIMDLVLLFEIQNVLILIKQLTKAAKEQCATFNKGFKVSFTWASQKSEKNP